MEIVILRINFVTTSESWQHPTFKPFAHSVTPRRFASFFRLNEIELIEISWICCSRCCWPTTKNIFKKFEVSFVIRNHHGDYLWPYDLSLFSTTMRMPIHSPSGLLSAPLVLAENVYHPGCMIITTPLWYSISWL